MSTEVQTRQSKRETKTKITTRVGDGMCNHLKRVTRDLVTSSARCTVTLRTPGLSVGAGGRSVVWGGGGGGGVV